MLSEYHTAPVSFEINRAVHRGYRKLSGDGNMRNTLLLPGLFFLLFLVPGPALIGADAVQPQPEQADEAEVTTILDITAFEKKDEFNEFNLEEFINLDIDVTLHGDLWFYQVWENNPRFRDGHAAFLETIARVGLDISYDETFAAQVRAVGTDVHKRPENWTAPRRTDWATRADLANISLSGDLGGLGSTLTVGLQELSYGDGLLIHDGFSEKRAFWSTPIRSFPAVRWSANLNRESTLDLFTAIVHDDYLSHEAFLGSRVLIEGGGQVTGANLNVLSADAGEIDVGLFYKDDNVDRDDNAGLDTSSNTWALSLRDSIRPLFDFLPKFMRRVTVTGEIVKQWGHTKVVENTITSDRHSRSAWGGQLSARYDFSEADSSPYVQARWAQFQGDSRSSSAVESFDPFFSGYGEWGSQWRTGDISGLFLPNSNKRALTLEFGMVPVERTKLRILIHDISLDSKMRFSGSPQWSNEINVIFEHNPCDYAFIGLMLAAAEPGGAAETYYMDDKTQTQIALWAGLHF